VKYLVLLGVTLPCFLAQRWWLTGAALLVTAALLLAARIPARRALGVTGGLVALIAGLALYQGLIQGFWLDGARGPALGAAAVHGLVLGGNLLVAIWAARLVTMTTPSPVLVDALVRGVGPLRRLGFPAERFGLAVHVMLRSIPYLMGSFASIRQAAAARGLERRVGPQVAQVAVRAVAYAQATGDAMAARGLGDEGRA
jgi:biotin transport system permease protein